MSQPSGYQFTPRHHCFHLVEKLRFVRALRQQVQPKVTLFLHVPIDRWHNRSVPGCTHGDLNTISRFGEGQIAVHQNLKASVQANKPTLPAQYPN